MGDVRGEDQSGADLFCPFRLPEADFEDLMYERRFEQQQSSSPTALSELAEVQGAASEPEEGKSHSVDYWYWRG